MPPSGGLAERFAFLRAYARDWRVVGAVTPTSRAMSNAIAEYAGASQRRAVAELGAGTGPITRALLEQMPPDGRLWAFEIAPRFVEHLRTTIHDPRLTVVPLSAAEAPRVAREAGIQGFDAIVSALPFSVLGHRRSREIVARAHEAMLPGAPFVALQYNPTLALPLMRRQFGRVDVRPFLWNVPPGLLLRSYANGAAH